MSEPVVENQPEQNAQADKPEMATAHVSVSANGAKPAEPQKPEQKSEQKFSQEDLDRVVADRLGRQKAQYSDAQKKAAEYDKLIESQKSESQRQQEALEAANNAAKQAQADAVRFKAAAKYGIGEDFFDMLGGGTEDEVFARAEKLGNTLKQAGQASELQQQLDALSKGAPTRTPVANLRPGATPADQQVPEDSYPAHWAPQQR